MKKQYKDYDSMLSEQFKNIEINIVKHDTSPMGLPCYIEAHLGSNPKDKGALVLDLGNYIYRTTGLSYQMTPEFRGRGNKTTVRWFLSWENVSPVIGNICKAVGKPKLADRYLPVEFRSLIIQKARRHRRAKAEK